MDILQSRVDTNSPDFQRKHGPQSESRAERLAGVLRQVREGGGERAVNLHRRRGKMLARERIDALLDPDPVSGTLPLAAHDMYPARSRRRARDRHCAVPAAR